MFRKSPFFSILAMILVVAMLVGAGMAIFRAGYAQGVVTEFDGDAGELISPWGFHPGAAYHYRFMPFGFGLFGLFFKGLLFLMFVSFIGRMFFFRRGRMACGPHPAAWKYWHDHPEAQKWGRPPWAKDGETRPDDAEVNPSEESEVEPEE